MLSGPPVGRHVSIVRREGGGGQALDSILKKK